jgi:hypothetical protein
MRGPHAHALDPKPDTYSGNESGELIGKHRAAKTEWHGWQTKPKPEA